MNPYQHIEAEYAGRGDAPFLAYVDWYHRHGVVHSTPEYFVMMRAVDRRAPEGLITDATHLFPLEQCNCWYVHAMAGNMAKAWDGLPYLLGWMAWHRLDDATKSLRFYETEKIRRLTQINPWADSLQKQPGLVPEAVRP